VILPEHIYQSLIEQGGEVIGALAYSIYKQHKVEWTIQYLADNQALPDEAALTAFRATNLLPGMMQGYLERGQTLAQQFLSVGLDQKVREIGLDVRQSALARAMQENITAQLNEKKSAWGYVRDAGASIMTNIIALILAGALILGWKSLDDLNAAVSNWSRSHAEPSTRVVPGAPPPPARPPA
jgi:hypothetical protein